jgi:prefoldin subunit 1
MEKELRTQEKELTDDIENLNKKVRQANQTYYAVLSRTQEKFLQKQYDEAQGQLKDIVRHCCCPRELYSVYLQFRSSKGS